MDKAIATALFKAANGNNCVVMMNDAARINTNTNEGTVILNHDKGLLIAVRPNDDTATFIKDPIEVFTTEYENITSISINGDYNKAVASLKAMQSAGLLTSAQYNECMQSIVKSDMVYNKDFTTSLENTRDTLGYKTPVRNVSVYGGADREPSEGDVKYDPTPSREYEQPEIIKL